MDKVEVLKIKNKIATLRRIADGMPPCSMKQLLFKRAEELGKKIYPFVKAK